MSVYKTRRHTSKQNKHTRQAHKQTDRQGEKGEVGAGGKGTGMD